MLTGLEIIRRIKDGQITIDPFNPAHVGSNSVDLTLSPKLKIYSRDHLDMKEDNPTEDIEIPREGFWMMPGVLYLGLTNEIAGCTGLVPCISGRSSVGRLGISVHVTAGFGDDGFVNRWTLEMTCVKAVRIYPNVRICQIYFEELQGQRQPYSGKYAPSSMSPVPSHMFKDFR